MVQNMLKMKMLAGVYLLRWFLKVFDPKNFIVARIEDLSDFGALRRVLEPHGIHVVNKINFKQGPVLEKQQHRVPCLQHLRSRF